MKILKHFNFPNTYGKEETYKIYQEHYNRDTKIHLWWEIVFIIFAAGGIYTTGNNDLYWLFGGAYALERKLSRFIDNSNRNNMMHLIDWMESREVISKKVILGEENKSEPHDDDE